MKKPQLWGYLLLALLLLVGWASAVHAQALPVTVSPAYCTGATPVTLPYDATLGNGTLNTDPGHGCS